MTIEEQRNAIAGKCGWKYGDTNIIAFGASLPLKGWSLNGKRSIPAKFPPDYTDDLNAMHEAEKVLDADIKDGDSLRYNYAREIYKLCSDEQQPFRASASVRAEAFCRVFWSDKFKGS